MNCKVCKKLYKIDKKNKLIDAKFLAHYQLTHGVNAKEFVRIFNELIK